MTDDVGDVVDDLHERATALQADEAALATLFTPGFMQRHTDAESLRAFFAASEWDVETRTDFAKVSESAFDEYVAAATDFPDWESMLGRASEEWMARQLVE
jgi:hypothetical protein